MHKVFKYILLFISGIFILVLLLLLFTQTRAFRQIARQQVLKIANEQLNGKVYFEKLEGSFFCDLSFHNFEAELPDGDTILSFSRLSLKYSAWPLLNNVVDVRSIELENPRFFLEQGPDSAFTFLQLFPRRVKEEEDTIPPKPLKLAFKLRSFKLNNGHVNLAMHDTIVPEWLKNLDIELAGSYSSGNIEADLKHLGFQLPANYPDLEHFQVALENMDSIWSVRNFELVTPLNRIGLDGSFSGLGNIDVSLVSAPLFPDEFSLVLPDFSLGVSPEINFSANVVQKDLMLDVSLKNQSESIGLKGQVNRFPDLLNDSTRHLSALDLSLSLRNLSPEKWFLLSDFPLLLNGDIKLTGNGLAGSNLPLKVKGNFSGSRWEQYRFSNLSFNGQYLDGNSKIRAHIVTPDKGVFDLDAAIHINKPSAPFRLNLKAQDFPVERFLPKWADSTRLNMVVEARGTGHDAESLDADFSVSLEQSVAARVGIDSLFLSGAFNRGDISVDTFLFSNPSVWLKASGTYNQEGSINSSFESDVYDVYAFAHYIEIPVRWKKLMLKGSANGKADSLMLDVLARADSLQYDTIARVANLNLTGQGKIMPDGFSGNPDLKLSGIEAFGQKADSLHLIGSMENDAWNAAVSLWAPDSMGLHTELQGGISPPYAFKMSVLDIFSLYEDFSLDEDTVRFFMDSTRMELRDFSLTAQTNQQFKMRAGGYFLPGDSLDLDFTLNQLDLSMLSNLGIIEFPVSGMVSAGVNAKGDLSDPVFDVGVKMDSLVWNQLRIAGLSMDVDHKGDSLYASLEAHNHRNDSLSFTGKAPLNISLTDSQLVSNIKSFEGRFQTQQLHPSAFFEFDDPQSQFYRAELDADVAMSGTPLQPVLKGFVNIANGQISLPAYGIRYKDLKLKSRLDSNQVIIDSLFIRRDKGTFLIKGDMSFDNTLISGNFSAVNMTLKARDFFVSDHQNHEIQINSDAWIKTQNEAPVFGGNLTVLRSNFYLPAILDMGGSAEINKPMLVKAMEEKAYMDTGFVAESDTIYFPQEELDTKNPMMEGLTGKINVRIPRNTWVKSEDMNIELYGDFDLLKNNEYFEIFGTLGISRGYYSLYGRKLIIQEGELTFQGGEKLNPRVNVEAVYQFRGRDKQKNELVMKAGGTAFEPNLSFTLNGNSITERDAMAFLVFNQSFDQLSASNQDGVSGNMPSAMLSGLVSSQLTKTIGNTFALDMVEVKAGDDWTSGAFMVGKYITNNLFVTYQRSFGEGEEESLTPQTITLEYEITRNISFRLTQGDVKDSGIDVILKFQKE
jgi:translocation and assembly module TamB